MDCNLGMGEPYCVPLVAAHDCIVDCPSFVDERKLPSSYFVNVLVLAYPMASSLSVERDAM